MKSKAHGGCRGTIFRLLDMLPKITDGTNGERYTLFRGVCHTLNHKKRKRGLKSKAWGGGPGTIFSLLDILPKITDRTNGERYTLFRVVCNTLNPPPKKRGEI